MTTKRSFIIGIILKAALIVAAAIGLYATFYGSDGFMTSSPLLYFTIQSNIWIALTMLAFVALDIAGRTRGKSLIRNWMRVTKFVFTVSITLTLLVFAFLLAPTMGWEYLRSPSNLCLHFIVPVLAIVDFILFDYGVVRKRFTFALATVPPIAYFVVTMLLSFGGVRYQNGDIAPYYFLNYEKLGWFRISSQGIGVCYWVLVMIVIVCGVGLALLKTADLRRGKREKAQ